MSSQPTACTLAGLLQLGVTTKNKQTKQDWPQFYEVVCNNIHKQTKQHTNKHKEGKSFSDNVDLFTK